MNRAELLREVANWILENGDAFDLTEFDSETRQAATVLVGIAEEIEGQPKDVPDFPGPHLDCDGSQLASIEAVTGLCDHNPEGEPMGYTEMNWDTTQTIGWYCRNCENTWGLPREVIYT